MLTLPLCALLSPSLQALEKYNIEKDIAAFVKKEFDKKYNPTWHCIVGRNFGEQRAILVGSSTSQGPPSKQSAHAFLPPHALAPCMRRLVRHT